MNNSGLSIFKSSCKTCISCTEFIILELSINNKLNNEHEVKKSERGKRGYRMRKTRSDCRVGTFEKKNGLPPGTIRNKDGRDTRSDKKIGTIRKEARRK